MAIKYDNSSTGAAGSQNTTYTLAHTATGTNGLVLVLASCEYSYDITGVTWNGNAMTQVGSNQLNNNSSKASLWYYFAGTFDGASHNVVITCSGSNYIRATIASYVGVKQTGLDSYSQTARSSSNPYVQSTTVVAPECWTIAYGRNDAGDMSAGIGATSRSASVAMIIIDSNGKVPTGSQSLNIATPGGNTVGTIISVAPASIGRTLGEYNGAGSGTTKLLLHLNGNSADESGNNNHGTDTAITYSQANGKFGQGAGFNGSTSVIDLGTTASLKPTSVTLSMWVKYTSIGGALFIKKSATTGGHTAYGIEDNGSGLSSRVQLTASTYSDISTSGVTVHDNTWHNVVLTFTSGSHKLYVDGVLRGLGTPTSGGINYETDAKASIGNSWSGTWENPITGNIDEVIIDSEAWSAEKIKKYYTMTKGRFGII